jgi:hypothetical protein
VPCRRSLCFLHLRTQLLRCGVSHCIAGIISEHQAFDLCVMRLPAYFTCEHGHIVQPKIVLIVGDRTVYYEDDDFARWLFADGRCAVL